MFQNQILIESHNSHGGRCRSGNALGSLPGRFNPESTMRLPTTINDEEARKGRENALYQVCQLRVTTRRAPLETCQTTTATSAAGFPITCIGLRAYVGLPRSHCKTVQSGFAACGQFTLLYLGLLGGAGFAAQTRFISSLALDALC